MKYLWVEDFGDIGYKNELEEKWKNYYCLKDKELIIQPNLEETLEYIQDYPNGFDVVLLDINFPIFKPNSSSNIYEDYFSNIITKKFFDKNKETGAGILLFLYLVLKFRFPKERIVFLSANILENTDEKNIPDDIKEALKYIDVDNVKQISQDDYETYDGIVYDINENYKGKIVLKYKDEIEELNESEFKQYVRVIKEKCNELFNTRECDDSDNANESDFTQVKYNAAKKEFEKIGFKLSKAFPKPDINEKGYDKKFKQWIETTETKYARLRRYIIEMSNIIESNLSDDIIVYDKYSNKKNLDDEIFSIKYKNLLENIKLMPIISFTNHEEKHVCYRIVNQITHDWESSKKPIYFVPNKKILTLCNNYKDCVLEKFGYRGRGGYCKIKNQDCNDIIVNNKCKKADCKFSKDFKVESKYNTYLCENEKPCDYKYTIENFAYNSVLKMVRNWLAHNKLEEKKIDVGLAAFIFGIGMRGLFDVESLRYKKEEYLKWENKLIDLIGECYNENEEDYRIDENSIINMISKSCFDFYNIAKDLNDFAYSPNIGSVLHLIGSENSNLRCNWKYILRLFAHCLFPIEIKSEFKEDEGKYEFKLEVNTDFLEKEDAIELKYFKAIYKACLV